MLRHNVKNVFFNWLLIKLVILFKKNNMIESADNNEKEKGKKTETTGKTPVLDNFSRDLIKAAEEGKLDPVIGREQEINRIAQILSRRKKNNPIIIGEPGVEKLQL